MKNIPLSVLRLSCDIERVLNASVLASSYKRFRNSAFRFLLAVLLYTTTLSCFVANADPDIKVVTDPADGVLTCCWPIGNLGVAISSTNQCWGAVITNWNVSGDMHDVTWGIVAGNAIAVFIACDTPPGAIKVTATVVFTVQDPHTGNLTTSTFPVNGSFEVRDTCTTSCSSNTTAPDGSPAPALGTANVSDNLGPYVSFNLGAFSSRQNAGALALDAQATSASLSSPSALYAPYVRSNATVNVDVVTNGSGVITQVNAPDGLINIAVVNAYQYQLQMFYNTNVTAKTNGLYGTNAAAFDVWTITNPNGATNNNQL